MARGVWRPRWQRISREEYLIRAYEFAHKKNRIFTDQQVQVIRIRASMRVTAKRMAQQYGVHVRTIEKIISYEAYAT